MTERRVTRAIVLAAGTGSRLSEGADTLPKPLRVVGGVPLVVRVLRTLRSAGIQEAVVITGFQGEAVRRALRAEHDLGLKLSFVNNPHFDKKNGVSLLAAAAFVDRECLLTMSDHLYSPELVRRLLSADVPEGSCALAVDYEIERCFDLDDATKVGVENGKIKRIGKELESYEALDTGVFRIGPALIAELAAVQACSGDCSLSDGVQALSRRGRFLATNVGDVRWVDVDTPQAMACAEAMLRVFGDTLGDEPGSGQPPIIDPETIEFYAPSWVRAAKPYNEDHFALADSQSDVLRMMSNESPYSPSPRVINAIIEAATRGNFYPGGAPALKSKLAQKDNQIEGSVILGAGSTELIDLVIRTFVGPGEEVLLSVPTFSMYEARTRTVGGIPVLIPMSEDHEHDLGGLIRGVTERTKVIFLCTPNNPTGGRISEVDLKRLLRLGLPTVIDEAYHEFSEGASFSRLLEEFPNAIVLRTFSKAYGLAGIRLGYALAHPAVVRLLSRVKVPWNIPAVTLAAASAALDDAAEFDARMLELRLAREEFTDRLQRIDGLSPVPSEGNFVLIDVSATGQTAERLVESMLTDGVLIRSLSVHHAKRSYVRVTVGTREQNARCLSAFERVLGGRGRREAPRAYLTVAGGDAE